MNPRERPGKRGMVFPPSYSRDEFSPAEEEAHERLQEAEAQRAPADDETTIERMADAMAAFDGACDSWPRRGVSLSYYRGLARVALTAALGGEAA